MQTKTTRDLSIVIAGEAGQGIQSIEKMLVLTLKRHGYHVCAMSEYMSRIRGGTNSTTIRVSDKPRGAMTSRIDLFLPLHHSAMAHCKKRLTEKTIIIGDKEKLSVGNAWEIMDVKLEDIAYTIGNRMYANTVAAGVLLGILEANKKICEEIIRSAFARKGEEIVAKNIEAFLQGLKIGEKFSYADDITVVPPLKKDTADDIILNGAEAVGFGALAGGCNFISSYPMSPSTGVLTFLANHGKECGVVVEQATDEIGALNMALGAWYTGARAIVTTAGGGFALMGESVSLAGMIETPIVLHVAQRPGPATGLPTRTAQEDLNLVLYAGHGEFPRIIFAPGTLAQAYKLTQKAFNLADQYQVPVFVLTDQFLIDFLGAVPEEELPREENVKHIVATESSYQRYKLTKDGLSPRGVPGNGMGFVRLDSDEHDEDGRITESHDMRNQMTEKRLHKKLRLLQKEIIAPDLVGKSAYKILVVCWGSNYHVAVEALECSGRSDISVLHFSQLFPLHSSAKTYIEKAEKVFVLENNATGQFANLLQRETGVNLKDRILKYSGEPFFVEELTRCFKAL